MSNDNNNNISILTDPDKLQKKVNFRQQFRLAASESDSFYEFYKKIEQYFIKNPLTLFGLTIYFILNLTQSIFGFLNLKNCPLQPKIPFYLMINGLIGLIKSLLLLIIIIKSGKTIHKSKIVETNEQQVTVVQHFEIVPKSVKYINFLLTLFIIVWFIFGILFTFAIPKPTFMRDYKYPTTYCNKLVYLISIMNLIVYTLFFIIESLFIGYLFYYFSSLT